MRTRVKLKAESAQRTRQTFLGFILRGLRVCVVSMGAKQSQFTSGARKTIAKASGLDAATRRTIAGPTVQNEPNFRRRRVGRSCRAAGHGANVRNEPNLADSVGWDNPVAWAAVVE